MSQKQPKQQQAPTRDPNASQRAALAISLRSQKLTYEEIAARAGYASAGAAHKAIMREVNRTITLNVEELRRQEAESLDELERRCWERLQDSEHNKYMLYAVDRILAIKERRAKLMGLDQTPDAANNLNVVVVRETPPNYLNPPQQEGQLL